MVGITLNQNITLDMFDTSVGGRLSVSEASPFWVSVCTWSLAFEVAWVCICATDNITYVFAELASL